MGACITEAALCVSPITPLAPPEWRQFLELEAMVHARLAHAPRKGKSLRLGFHLCQAVIMAGACSRQEGAAYVLAL